MGDDGVVKLALRQMAEHQRRAGRRLWHWQRATLNRRWTRLVFPPWGKIGLVSCVLKRALLWGKYQWNM